MNDKRNEPLHIGRLNSAGGCAKKGAAKSCRKEPKTTRANEAADGKMVREANQPGRNSCQTKRQGSNCQRGDVYAPVLTTRQSLKKALATLGG